MAFELQGFKFTAIAGENLSTKLFRFVKLSANNTVVVCNGVNDIPVGVLQNNPPVGGAAEVLVYGITKLVAGGSLVAADGKVVGTDGNGAGVAYEPGTDTSKYGVGQVVFGSGTGEIASVLIDCAKPSRLA